MNDPSGRVLLIRPGNALPQVAEPAVFRARTVLGISPNKQRDIMFGIE
jgi:hypothetical protein